MSLRLQQAALLEIINPATDICDDLSAANNDNTSIKGVYPTTFVFKGRHAQCRCFVAPILANRVDFVKKLCKKHAAHTPGSAYI